MNHQWPRQHLVLFALTGALLALLLIIFLAVVRPKAAAVRDSRNLIANTRIELERSGWPLDPDRIASLLEMKRRELEGANRSAPAKTARQATAVRDRSRLLLAETTALFDEPISRYFEHQADFVRDSSRLDFQDEYNQLEQQLAARNLFLAEPVLWLGERTTSPFNYQLLLQTWTAQRLAQLALNAGLQFRVVDDAGTTDEHGFTRKPIRLRLLPPRAYCLPKSSPFLLEFPARLGLAGSPGQLFNFLASLHQAGVFLPVSRIEILALPGTSDNQQETAVGIAGLAIELECSSFFQVMDDVSSEAARPQSSPRTLPKGA